MRTDKISSLTFESKMRKPRYITENMRASIESLLLRMNFATTVEEKGDHFISTITNKLKSIDGHVFEDERMYKKPLPYKEQMKGFSVLKFGRTMLNIDNESGEIIYHKKPFYKPWFIVLRKAEEVLNDLRAYFNQPDVVQRECIQIQDLTPEGAKKMKKFVLQVEKQRLEEVTDKLEREIENESK